jgi:hypothetical protein
MQVAHHETHNKACFLIGDAVEQLLATIGAVIEITSISSVSEHQQLLCDGMYAVLDLVSLSTLPQFPPWLKVKVDELLHRTAATLIAAPLISTAFVPRQRASAAAAGAAAGSVGDDNPLILSEQLKRERLTAEILRPASPYPPPRSVQVLLSSLGTGRAHTGVDLSEQLLQARAASQAATRSLTAAYRPLRSAARLALQPAGMPSAGQLAARLAAVSTWEDRISESVTAAMELAAVTSAAFQVLRSDESQRAALSGHVHNALLSIKDALLQLQRSEQQGKLINMEELTFLISNALDMCGIKMRNASDGDDVVLLSAAMQTTRQRAALLDRVCQQKPQLSPLFGHLAPKAMSMLSRKSHTLHSIRRLIITHGRE